MADEEKHLPNEIKTLTFLFDNGEQFALDMKGYSFKLDATGIFVTEPAHKNTTIITPQTEMRTVEFIQMININRVHFDYYD